jgi:hypothetical protein
MFQLLVAPMGGSGSGSSGIFDAFRASQLRQ